MIHLKIAKLAVIVKLILLFHGRLSLQYLCLKINLLTFFKNKPINNFF